MSYNPFACMPKAILRTSRTHVDDLALEKHKCHALRTFKTGHGRAQSACTTLYVQSTSGKPTSKDIASATEGGSAVGCIDAKLFASTSVEGFRLHAGADDLEPPRSWPALARAWFPRVKLRNRVSAKKAGATGVVTYTFDVKSFREFGHWVWSLCDNERAHEWRGRRRSRSTR